MMGVERNYKERQRERLIFPKCGRYLSRGSLATHYQIYNVTAKGVTSQEVEGEGGGDKTRTYCVSFLARAGPRHCPVEGCSGRAATWTAMRVHL